VARSKFVSCSKSKIESRLITFEVGYESIEYPLSTKRNIQDLGYIMMELMQGYVKEGPHVGLDDPERWSMDTVNFLSTTTSASSVDELKKVCLF
jgi:hypothetical protein